MQRKIFLLLCLALRADADGTDVTNNLFSDLGPLLALFGESFAQQFLRESFTWLDHIIFAMAPLGIITAIIGAIRVGGPPQLKALIGRARENRASAELDFMSSTSHEVSELWNGHGIVRTMGKGKVKQILFLEGRGTQEEFGLFTLTDAEKENLIIRKAYSDPLIDIIKEIWRKKTQKLWERTSVSKSPNNDSHNNMSGRINPKEGHVENDGLDRAPNISLNIHPKQNRGELFAAAVLGFILQVGVIIFSAFVAYDTRFGAAVGGRPSAYAFPTLASGTAVLVFGMGVCALVIGESTDENIWELKADGNVTTLQDEQSHQSKFKAPSGDVEAGGANHSHSYHKHLWKRILEVFTNIPTKEGERKTKFLSESLEPNAKKGDSEERKFLVFWLQQRFVVSDQTFDSYMLMARMEKELIMTSCRSNNHSLGANSSHSTVEDSFNKTRNFPIPTFQTQPSNTISSRSARSSRFHSRTSKAQTPPLSSTQMPPHESAPTWINTLCILGTSTGIIGFILQFEGFRGISWACSIAQLVAILIMTVVRAIIRRGMLDRPIAQKIPDKYEIDWLALRLGNDDKYLSDLSKSNDKHENPSCYWCGRFYTHKCKILYWKVSNEMTPLSQTDLALEPITKESLAQDISDISDIRKVFLEDERLLETLANNPTAQDIMQMWQFLQDRNPSWEPYKRTLPPTYLIAITRLEAIVGQLELTGWLEPSEEPSAAQKVVNLRKRLGELTGWYDPEIRACAASVATAIEKIMVLFPGWPGSTFYWFIDVQIENASANATSKVKLKAARNLKKKNSWCVSASEIESIISLWVYHLSDHRQMSDEVQGDNKRSVPVIRSFQRVIGPVRPHLKRDLAWWASIEISEALGEFTWNDQQDRECLSLGFGRKGFSGSKPGKSKSPAKLYTMMANVSKEKFLAQHIFSIFMWSIVSSLPIAQRDVESKTEVTLPSDDKFKINVKDPNWNSLRLTNEKIKDMTKAVEISGLGSLEDAQLLIIPPLSYSYKLPSGKMIDEVRNRVKENEVGYQDTACSLYEKLLELCEHLPLDGTFVHKVVSTSVDFLVTAASVSVSEEGIAITERKSEKSRISLAKAIESKHKECLSMLRSLYDKQGRLQSFEKVGLKIDVDSPMMKNKVKNGHTPLHQQIIDNSSGRLNLDVSRPYLDVPDILGWTPLHYAVIYSHSAVAALVDKEQELASNIDLARRTPLHYAVMGLNKDLGPEKTKQIISKLLEANSEPRPGRDGLFPLHWAVRTGNVVAIELLLEKDLQKNTIDKQDYWKMTPLHFAAAGGHLEILKLLLNKRGTPQIIDAQDQLLQTALHIAVKKIVSPNKADIVLELLNRGANVEIKDENNKTALELAAEMERDYQHSTNGPGASERRIETERTTSPTENIKLSIKYILHKQNLGVDGGKLLLWAAKNNYKTPFDVLIDSKRINEDDKQTDVDTQQSILHFAVKAESSTMVDRILERWKFNTTDSSVAKDDNSPKTVSPLDLRDNSGITALMLAASKGFESGVTRLLASGANIYIKDDSGRTALSWAAEKGQLNTVRAINQHRPIKESTAENVPMSLAVITGNFDIVEFFLESEGKSNSDDTDVNGYSMLCLAVIHEHRDIVNLLIGQKAAIEKQSGPDNRTPLSWAAENGNLEIIKLLLENHASLEAKDAKDRTPLIWAAISGQLKAVEVLFGEGNLEFSTGKQYSKHLDSAMFLACRTGYVELVNRLFMLGANPNVQDDASGLTLLTEAIRANCLEIVNLLLNNGASVDGQNRSRSTALHEAVAVEQVKIVMLLLMRRANVNAVNEAQETPLLLAIDKENASITKLLLEAGADVNLTDNSKQTPLLRAASNTNIEIMELLLRPRIRAEINKADDNKETPLARAVRSENEAAVRLLLEADAEVNTEDSKQKTPLFWAVDNENPILVELLLDARANANTENEITPPLFQAVYDENPAIVQLLLEKGAEINKTGYLGRTPLFQAVFDENPTIIQLLLRKNADVNIIADNGRSPLFQAVCDQNTSIINILLEAKADVHIMGDAERTPLSQAICIEESAIVHTLLENGADVKIHTTHGKTPLHESAQCNTEEILNDLLLHGADITEVDTQGRNVFHFSADSGCTSILKTLVHKSQEARGKKVSFNLFNPAFRDKQGRDVFHHAAVSKSAETVSYLLKLSSDRSLHHRADTDGWTPLHWAARAGDVNVILELIMADSDLDAKKPELTRGWTPRQIASYNGHDMAVGILGDFSNLEENLPLEGMYHESVSCDGCYCSVYGSRFKCMICEDFDFCEKCNATRDETHKGHEFDKIVLERNRSSSISSYVDDEAANDKDSTSATVKPEDQNVDQVSRDN